MPEHPAQGGGMGQEPEPGNRLADQPPGIRPYDHIGHLQGPMADRTVFQGPQAESKGEDIRRYHRECAVHSDLDSIDRHAADQVPQLQGQIWLVAVKPRGLSPLEPVYLQRFMGVDRPSLRCSTDYARVCPKSTSFQRSWTALTDHGNLILKLALCELLNH